MGFCLFNNIAIAAASARRHGIERILIVDWDVHHGNGTQEMFWRDPHVLFASLHQFPFYPGTGAARERGEGDGTGYTVNIPLSPGQGDSVYRTAFERVLLPIADEFRPELVLVSAGFDAATADPLAQMEVSDDGFGWMARALAAVADKHAAGRMALVLEGGYDLGALEGGLRSAVRAMLSPSPEATAVEAAREGAETPPEVARAIAVAKKAWRSVG
jgi:acetoin utilization deacetylase AcuC-like enzyme